MHMDAQQSQQLMFCEPNPQKASVFCQWQYIKLRVNRLYVTMVL